MSFICLFVSFSFCLFVCCNQRLVEQIGLYEVNNFDSVSAFLPLLGQLCTISALRDVCRFMLGVVFGPYEPTNYYDVMHLETATAANRNLQMKIRINKSMMPLNFIIFILISRLLFSFPLQ